MSNRDNMRKRRRADPDKRAKEILAAALVLSEQKGYKVITREDIAVHAGCSVGLIGKYFGDMDRVRTRIMEHAVAEGCAEVVLQGLVTRHPVALKAPEELRTAAKNLLDDPHFTDL